jgi:flagellar motor switch protein FliG
MLSAVLRQVDADVLALALAGSHEELVDRICDQMPKRTAREFRRQLRRLGPTRLSDVEAAQRAVAQVAARQLAERRQALAAARI